ncbi:MULTISPECIES: prolyl oligopeptidase family serine peptidase [unclassified Agromyces]|uniref:prolyl oligopeptidase family serine peptidase n=1 Tax=unclassified Agromyces TaxID=2639701 RepID=UPI003014FECC
MPEPRALACGTWPSQVTAADVAAARGSLQWLELVDGVPWWVEGLPGEGGRLALMRLAEDGSAAEVTPPGASARNRVHEYGGRPWCPVPGRPGAHCFTDWRDHRLHAVEANGASRALTPAAEVAAGDRYAEPVVVGDEVWVLREHHRSDDPTYLERAWIAVPLDGSAGEDPGRVRALTGTDAHRFLAGLRVSPDGRRAAWIGWNHPDMPWDATEVVVAEVVDGRFARARVVAGGPGVSVCQVEWRDDARLLYSGDASGWWNLVELDLASGARRAVTEDESELGGPLWKTGSRWFALVDEGRAAALQGETAVLVDLDSGRVAPIDGADEHGVAQWAPSISAGGGRVAGIGSGPRALPRVFVAVVDPAPVGGWGDGGGFAPVGGHEPLPRRIDGSVLDAAWLPSPRFEFLTVPGGLPVPAHVWPPTNPLATALPGELPPYVVHVHGGPTGSNGVGLDLEIAYFTSRGIGVVAPEYGGSTGFGRAWRERLRGAWGDVDLADAETAALALVDSGEADPDRLVVRGGSAGGFTSAALMTRPSAFRAGLVSYPVIDLVAWASGETHDFESQYLAGLVGPLPDAEARYRERSPSDRADAAHGPILVLQGLDDPICLPESTERFVARLAEAGVPYRYVGYAGEGHGFRRAETLRHAIAAEFAWVVEVFGIDPVAAEPAEPQPAVDRAGR